MKKCLWIFWVLVWGAGAAYAQNIKLGLLVYSGGGDWYANPSSLRNLAQFCNENLNTYIDLEEGQVDVGSPGLFHYPFVHLTGHGRWVLSDAEARNLRTYLMGGGFLHIDDNYGLDPYVRPALKQVFPELELVEVPWSHSIYQHPYPFPQGLPKIHEHDEKPPQGFGLFYEGRLVCFYSYQTDLGDGWEDPAVHQNPPERRLEALRFGANLISYVFLQQDSSPSSP